MLETESVLFTVLFDWPRSYPIRRAVTSGAAPSISRLLGCLLNCGKRLTRQTYLTFLITSLDTFTALSTQIDS